MPNSRGLVCPSDHSGIAGPTWDLVTGTLTTCRCDSCVRQQERMSVSVISNKLSVVIYRTEHYR